MSAMTTSRRRILLSIFIMPCSPFALPFLMLSTLRSIAARQARKGLKLRFRKPGEDAPGELRLQFAALLYYGRGRGGADKARLRLSPGTSCRAISPSPGKPVHMEGDYARLEPAEAAYIPRRGALRIIGREHENIHRDGRKPVSRQSGCITV